VSIAKSSAGTDVSARLKFIHSNYRKKTVPLGPLTPLGHRLLHRLVLIIARVTTALTTLTLGLRSVSVETLACFLNY
jgi:hypothetical protein